MLILLVSPWNELLQKQTTADDKCEQKILRVQDAQFVLNIDSVLLSMLCPAQFGSSLQLLKKGKLHKLTTHQQTHAAPLFITLHSDPVKWVKPWQSSSARRAKGDSSHSRSSPLCSDNRNHISETESKKTNPEHLGSTQLQLYGGRECFCVFQNTCLHQRRTNKRDTFLLSPANKKKYKKSIYCIGILMMSSRWSITAVLAQDVGQCWRLHCNKLHLGVLKKDRFLAQCSAPRMHEVSKNFFLPPPLHCKKASVLHCTTRTNLPFSYILLKMFLSQNYTKSSSARPHQRKPIAELNPGPAVPSYKSMHVKRRGMQNLFVKYQGEKKKHLK